MYPTLITSSGGEVVAICDLANCWADPHNTLREAVAVLAPDEVALAYETFVSLTPDSPSSGDGLAERFRCGDPAVSQAIEVLRMTRSGEGEQVSYPYSYSEDTVAWSEPGEPIFKLEGHFPDSLRAGFADAGKPCDRDDARAALRALGVRVRFVADPNPFDDAVPGDPCPCGSKRKYQDCHGY